MKSFLRSAPRRPAELVPMIPPPYSPNFRETELREPGWFPEMAKQVDMLVAAAPHPARTDGMFNEQIFRSMRKGSYLGYASSNEAGTRNPSIL